MPIVPREEAVVWTFFTPLSHRPWALLTTPRVAGACYIDAWLKSAATVVRGPAVTLMGVIGPRSLDAALSNDRDPLCFNPDGFVPVHASPLRHEDPPDTSLAISTRINVHKQAAKGRRCSSFQFQNQDQKSSMNSKLDCPPVLPIDQRQVDFVLSLSSCRKAVKPVAQVFRRIE